MSEYTNGLTAEQLIEYIAKDYVELSHEKIVVQRNDFMTICREWLQENLSETCIKQKDYKYEADGGSLTKDQIKQLKETLTSQSDVTHPKQRTGNCLLTGVCASEGHKIQKEQAPQHALMAEYWKAEYDKLKAKQWVGLTHEDIDKAIEDNQRFGGFRKVGFAYDLELVLKEKNNGPR